MLCDAALILLAGVVSGVGYHLWAVEMKGDVAQYLGCAAMVAALFIGLAKAGNLYELSELLNFKSQIRRLCLSWAFVFLFLTAVAFAMKLGNSLSRGATISFAVSGLAALIALRVFWRTFLADGLAIRRFAGRKIVLITDAADGAELGLLQTLTQHGLKLARHFPLPGNRFDTERRRAVIQQAISCIRGSEVEEIVVGADVSDWPELRSLLTELRVLPLPVNLVPLGKSSEVFHLPSHTIGDTVTIELQRRPRALFARAVKRALDIVGAAICLLLLMPLMLVVSVAIKVDSQGPILFRQRRCGFNGRQFQILKFRTMTVQEDGQVVTQAKRNDSRVTPIGRWLRRTSIDELPQLFNVLQGSMSLIGPRPHAVAHDSHFDTIVRNYAFRHHVKPGLTGWAQVNGYRGETRTVDDIEQRVKLDLWYIDNWSIGLDLRIATMTAIEVLRTDRAY
jgi:Undecaprenyl-phosphate glucose phosphotransferase